MMRSEVKVVNLPPCYALNHACHYRYSDYFRLNRTRDWPETSGKSSTTNPSSNFPKNQSWLTARVEFLKSACYFTRRI